MFYLTTFSTHFMLRLYGVGDMVKDCSDSEKGNLDGLFFLIRSESLMCTFITSCCSVCLSRVPLSRTGKKKGGGGQPALVGTRGYK